MGDARYLVRRGPDRGGDEMNMSVWIDQNIRRKPRKVSVGAWSKPGPWRIKVRRTRHSGFSHRLTVRVMRPGPARIHRWRVGPVRVVVMPSLGKLIHQEATHD